MLRCASIISTRRAPPQGGQQPGGTGASPPAPHRDRHDRRGTPPDRRAKPGRAASRCPARRELSAAHGALPCSTRMRLWVGQTGAARHSERRSGPVGYGGDQARCSGCRGGGRSGLFERTVASNSMKRVDDIGDADARSPGRAPFTVTSLSGVSPGARLGRSRTTNSCRPEPNSAASGSPWTLASSTAAPAFQPLVGAFHCRVVTRPCTSPAMSWRTFHVQSRCNRAATRGADGCPGPGKTPKHRACPLRSCALSG